MRASLAHTRGFTLIEISVVLVVIGLIVGGILTGRDMIRAAEVRATISQIEKYNTAANTFRGKYGYLPGDIKDPDASQFGFAPRGQYAGEGDGNGVIEGVDTNSGDQNFGVQQGIGETTMFWVDLSAAHLIDGTFNTASSTADPGNITASGLNAFYPAAKLGTGYIYVWSGGWVGLNTEMPNQDDGLNYFGLTGITEIRNTIAISQATLTVAQAYSIDSKIDDGLPQSGHVLALTLNWWASGGGAMNGDSDPNNGGPVTAGDGVATAPSSTTCYDNASVAGATEQYSMSTGGGMNCALSFRFQ